MYFQGLFWQCISVPCTGSYIKRLFYAVSKADKNSLTKNVPTFFNADTKAFVSVENSLTFVSCSSSRPHRPPLPPPTPPSSTTPRAWPTTKRSSGASSTTRCWTTPTSRTRSSWRYTVRSTSAIKERGMKVFLPCFARRIAKERKRETDGSFFTCCSRKKPFVCSQRLSFSPSYLAPFAGKTRAPSRSLLFYLFISRLFLSFLPIPLF